MALSVGFYNNYCNYNLFKNKPFKLFISFNKIQWAAVWHNNQRYQGKQTKATHLYIKPCQRHLQKEIHHGAPLSPKRREAEYFQSIGICTVFRNRKPSRNCSEGLEGMHLDGVVNMSAIVDFPPFCSRHCLTRSRVILLLTMTSQQWRLAGMANSLYLVLWLMLRVKLLMALNQLTDPKFNYSTLMSCD